MERKFEEYVARERENTTHAHAAVAFLSEVGTLALTVVAIRKFFPPYGLLWWFAASILVVSLSYFVDRKKRYFSGDRQRTKRWRFIELAVTSLLALSWGLLLIFFFAPGNMIYLAFVIAIYTGYVCGALSVNFNDSTSFVVFSLSISIPVAARFFYEGGEPYTMMGALVVFFCAMMNYVARNLNQQFIASMLNQYENERLVKELELEKEAVQRAVVAKDRFFASASHDLRQPLNAIGLFVDALTTRQQDDSSRLIVERLQTSLSGLKEMLHSVLDISTLDAGAIENSPSHTPICTLLNQLILEYKARDLSIEIKSNLPEEIVAYIDPNILYRVFRNLLDNAVKYTQLGFVEITVRESDGEVEITIQDTGAGIPKDKLDLVFEEFEQLHNPERDRNKGLGLGLAIVRRLCQVGGIKIDLHSVLGKGTTVKLLIPVGSADCVEIAEPKINTRVTDAHVLIIDDEQDILDGMKLVVSDWGAKVTTAKDLHSALDRLNEVVTVPDVVVCDFRLADNVSGIDVIQQIRSEFNRNIPAVMITGDTAPERISLAADAECDVMYKPIDSQDLKKKVINLLSWESI